MSALLADLPGVLKRAGAVRECMVYATSSVSVNTPYVAPTTLTAYNEIIDASQTFNNGVFTAPFSGVYDVSFGGHLHGGFGGLVLQKTAGSTVTTVAQVIQGTNDSNMNSRTCLVRLTRDERLSLAASNVTVVPTVPPYLQIQAVTITP